jgi:hypothetical protein
MYIKEHGILVKIDASTEKSIKAAAKDDEKVKIYKDASLEVVSQLKSSPKK